MSATIERLADHLKPAESLAGVEIVVCASERAARYAGFRSNRRHSADPSLVAWWPALGEPGLQTPRTVIRVTFLDDPYAAASSRQAREETARALRALQHRCVGPWLSTLP